MLHETKWLGFPNLRFHAEGMVKLYKTNISIDLYKYTIQYSNLRTVSKNMKCNAISILPHLLPLRLPIPLHPLTPPPPPPLRQAEQYCSLGGVL